MEQFKNMSPQTKSFIVLFSIAVVGCYVAFKLDLGVSREITEFYKKREEKKVTEIQQPMEKKNISTEDWKTYTNENLGLSFKIPETWKVKEGEKTPDGFSVLEIDPGQNYYNFKIYSNPESFYAINSLPAERVDINGTLAINVKNMIYGIKTAKAYVTFDLDVSLALEEEFNAMVHTIKQN